MFLRRSETNSDSRTKKVLSFVYDRSNFILNLKKKDVEIKKKF